VSDDRQANLHYRAWMDRLDARKVRTKDYGSCLKTHDAMTYIRLNGGEDVNEVDVGIQFVARGAQHTIAPIFLTGHGWLYAINDMNDLLFIHDGRL